MNNWIKFCSTKILALSLVFSACSTGNEMSSEQPETSSSPSFLWEVSKDGSQSFLFGTMHVSDPRVTTLTPHVERAFTKSDALFTELKESPMQLGAKVTEAGRLPKGTQLSDVIPADMYAKLRDFVESKKLSMSVLNDLRPWIIGMQLQLIEAMPYMQGVALDMQLSNRARKEGKTVGGVETIEEQIAALAFGNEQEQAFLLGKALDKLMDKSPSEKSEIEVMLENYIAGDIDALWFHAEKEVKDASELEKAAFDALLTKRNRSMADRVDDRISSNPDTVYFFAFGALHFAGPDGVNELLKNMGYEVNRVVK